MLVYLMLLNRTYVEYGSGQLRNTTAVLEQFVSSETVPCMSPARLNISNDTYISAITGSSFRISNGIRVAKYMVMGLDTSGEPSVFGMIDSAYIPTDSNDTSSIWATRGGFIPTAVPRCGFTNELVFGDSL